MADSHHNGCHRVVVVLPTYNESETIAATLDKLLATSDCLEVLVVDDNSPDGTANLVRAVAGRWPERVHLLLRPGRAGLGAAYRAGFSWALERHYDIVAQLDADGSHPIDRLPALLQTVVAGADLAVGSRYVPGGASVDWPLHRRVLSRVANWYARTLLSLPQRDLTGAYRVWRASALRAVDPAGLTTPGHGFLIELALAAHTRGLAVVEVPITFTDRVSGRSKMTVGIVIEAVLMVNRLRAAVRGTNRPARLMVGGPHPVGDESE